MPFLRRPCATMRRRAARRAIYGFDASPRSASARRHLGGRKAVERSRAPLAKQCADPLPQTQWGRCEGYAAEFSALAGRKRGLTRGSAAAPPSALVPRPAAPVRASSFCAVPRVSQTRTKPRQAIDRGACGFTDHGKGQSPRPPPRSALALETSASLAARPARARARGSGGPLVRATARPSTRRRGSRSRRCQDRKRARRQAEAWRSRASRPARAAGRRWCAAGIAERGIGSARGRGRAARRPSLTTCGGPRGQRSRVWPAAAVARGSGDGLPSLRGEVRSRGRSPREHPSVPTSSSRRCPSAFCSRRRRLPPRLPQSTPPTRRPRRTWPS